VYSLTQCCDAVAPKVEVDQRYRGPQEVKRGGMLVLPINFSGSPRPKVTWYHRGVRVTPRPGHVHIDYGDGYSTLSVSGIESNEGDRYEVVVENVAGAAELDFDVVVKCTLNCSFDLPCLQRRINHCAGCTMGGPPRRQGGGDQLPNFSHAVLTFERLV